jgi:exoribonuclease R
VGDIAVEHEALARSFRVDHGHFSEGVISSVNQFLSTHQEDGVWSIPDVEISKRRDFRNHRIFTIDPTTAKDLDDALHITLMDDGTGTKSL